MATYYLSGCPCCDCSGSVAVVANYVEGPNVQDDWGLSTVELRWYKDDGTLYNSSHIALADVPTAIPNLPLSLSPNAIPSTGDTLTLTLAVAQSYTLPCGVVTLPAQTTLAFTWTRGWAGSYGYYSTPPIIVQ